MSKLSVIIRKSNIYAIYVASTIISAAVHFIYSIYVKNQIEPLEYGIYSSCLLLQTYLTYVQLGSLNSFNRDYPQLIGANDLGKARRYRNNVLSFLIIAFSASAILISVILFVVCCFFDVDVRYIWGLFLCTVLAFVTVLESFATSRIRVENGFKFVSAVILVELLSVLAGVALIRAIGYYALYLTSIIAMVIGILCYYKKAFRDFKFEIDRSLLKIILLSGIPLLVNNLIWTIVNSIDKFVILGFLNTEALGLYSIAQMAFSYMVLIPNAISLLFYVKLGKIYGQTQNRAILNDKAHEFTIILSIVICFVSLIAFYFIEAAVNFVMPKYVSGIEAARILIIGLTFYAPTMVSTNILTILKKNAALVRSSIYLCIFNAVFSVGFVFILGKTIESVAYGTALSYLVRTMVIIVQLKLYAKMNFLEIFKSIVLPVLVLFLPGIALYFFFDNLFFSFILSMLLFLVFSFVFITAKKLAKNSVVSKEV